MSQKELTKIEVLERLSDRANYIHNVGQVASPNENYIEYIYDYIMDEKNNEFDKEKNELKKINQITRIKSYNVNHNGKKETTTNRQEEGFVLNLFYKNTDKNKVFGDLLAYQIPLRNTNDDKGIKAIDFAFKKNDNVYLAEIKAEYTGESPLKAILEIQTYYQILDKKKFLIDFDLGEKTKIKKCIVLFKDSIKTVSLLGNKYIKNLIERFEIEVIILEKTDSFLEI